MFFKKELHGNHALSIHSQGENASNTNGKLDFSTCGRSCFLQTLCNDPTVPTVIPPVAFVLKYKTERGPPPDISMNKQDLATKKILLHTIYPMAQWLSHGVPHAYFVYIYPHTCTYVCMPIYVNTHIHMYIYIYIYTHAARERGRGRERERETFL